MKRSCNNMMVSSSERYKCQRDIKNHDYFCDVCVTNIGRDVRLCKYIATKGWIKGFRCLNPAHENFDVCWNCISTKGNIDHILCDCCSKDEYNEILFWYLNNLKLKQSQLDNMIISALAYNSHINVETILFDDKFHPDKTGYNFLFNHKNYNQSTLSKFFYKRFIIKQVMVQSNNVDSVPQVLDPFMIKMDISKNLIKSILSDILWS